ncbi:MAG: TolC family protein [Acidobacteriaceae bacterium]
MKALLSAMLIILTHCGFGQDSVAANQLAQIVPASQTMANAAAPVVISLNEAIRRAEQNQPNFANAVAAQRAAARDRSIARAALLPNVRYHNEYLYTESSGARNAGKHAGKQAGNSDSFVFLPNNAIHEYVSQAIVTETLGLGSIGQVKRANAAAAQASALAEIAQRGLVFTVVQQYYGVFAAEQRLQVAKRAAAEASRFVDLTQKLERGEEVAHADVVKAQLQLQQRQRDLEDAQLLAENARLELGILLFPDPRTNYVIGDDWKQEPPVPDKVDVDAAAQRNNPDVRSAMEALRAAGEDISIARAAYFPNLSLNWTYGIDAPQVAVNGPLDMQLDPPVKPRNLGYSAFVSLDIPVWDWFATHDRVKQSEFRKTAAKVMLTYTQKRLLANLDEFYHDAEVAGKQVASLKQSVQTAADSLRLTNLRYRASEATVLEVVDAQNALSLAETAYANGAVRYRAALANLQTLTGVLP